MSCACARTARLYVPILLATSPFAVMRSAPTTQTWISPRRISVPAMLSVTLITDNMAGTLMRRGEIQVCVVGADRITANGDVANKIGTYSLAVLAHAHDIPFYVAEIGRASGRER